MNDMKAAMPLNEIARLEELRALGILDTSPEKTYQFFTAMACMVFSTPIAAIGLMDSDRQWFKAKLGIEQHQWKRDETVCSHTLLQDQLLEIPDISKDKRFKGLEQFKFYAGVPLISSKGHVLGTFFVADHKKRKLNSEQRETLTSLAAQVVYMIEYQAAQRLARQA